MSAAKSHELREYFKKHSELISPIVPFQKQSDRLFPFDFTESNSELNLSIIENTLVFDEWIRNKLYAENCRYGIGGYNEHRTIYARSELFDMDEEPRRLHLGVDIWGAAGTPVHAPFGGRIHSFKFNDNFGDYGATLILEHYAGELKFHTLYGHLSLKSITGLKKDTVVSSGHMIAEFGNITENGNWPPHLHFQLIFDMQNMEGDYPGVCRFSERASYLINCPDPNILLKQTFG